MLPGKRLLNGLMILVVLAMQLTSWVSPAQASVLPEEASTQTTSQKLVEVYGTKEGNRTLIQEKEIPLSPRYQPGTVQTSTGLYDLPYQVYLPILIKNEIEKKELALPPETWFTATQDWPLLTFENIQVAYPDVLTAQTVAVQDGVGFRLDDPNQIQVFFEPRESEQEAPSHLEELKKQGAQVAEVVVKGLKAWEVTSAHSNFCREVVVQEDTLWVSFRQNSGCQYDTTFNLILSSIQRQVHSAETKTNDQQDLWNPPGLFSPRYLVYNRSAAYNYMNQYALVKNNDDGAYLVSGGLNVDGGHFIAHVLQAGGFPIHYNAGQGNWDAPVVNIASQRNYLYGTGWARATAREQLTTGDVVYISSNGNYCWGGTVYRMSGGYPYIAAHSKEVRDSRYDYYNCGTGRGNDFVHIITYEEYLDPQINSGLFLNPTTQQTGSAVNASFNVHNFGGAGGTFPLRVLVNGIGEFPQATCSLPGWGDCGYNQSLVIHQAGSYQACAQHYINNTWSNIYPDGAGVACLTLNIVTPADVRLSNTLQVTPDKIDMGGTVQAVFTVKNQGGTTTTERFRVSVNGGAVTFPETANVSLAPNATYTYTGNTSFPNAGIYQITAEHLVNSTWTPLIGQGSAITRVMAPPPPPPPSPRGSATLGDPVNTATGNYSYDFSDITEVASDLQLEVRRWYNALQAATIKGPFGYGTTWEYGISVTWRPDKTALVVMPDGHTAYFMGPLNPGNPLDLSGTYTGQGQDIGTLVRAVDGTSVLTLPSQRSYIFNPEGKLTRISTPTPAWVNLVYNGTQLIELVHSNGTSFTIAYTGDFISKIETSSGRIVTYSYSPAGDLETAYLPESSNYTYLYDANHRLTEGRGPNGHAYVRNEYDAQGRVIRQYDQNNQLSEFSYDSGTFTQTYTDVQGNNTKHKYDTHGHLVEVVTSDGEVERFSYDNRGNILTHTDRREKVWSYTYDSNNNLLSETDPLGNVTTYQYDSGNRLIKKITPDGKEWLYLYNAQGLLTQVTDPLLHTRNYGYTSEGWLLWEEDENKHRTSYEYNQRGQPVQIIDALGGVTSIIYDAFGNRTSFTDSAGRTANFEYDDQNRLISSTDPLGTVIEFTYDPMGNLLTQSDGLGHLKSYTYDTFDRVVSETDFKGNLTSYEYNAVGQLVKITSPDGHTTTYEYDASGLRNKKTDRDGSVTTYAYDAEGNLTLETDAIGRQTEYVYDDAGRLTEMHYPCESCLNGQAIFVKEYNPLGQVVKETDPMGRTTTYVYDIVGRLATKTDALGNSYSYSYDPSGQLLQEINPRGAVTFKEYDALGRITTITDALNNQTVNQYDPVGNLIQVTDPMGNVTLYEYDANNRLSLVTDALGGQQKREYDAAGRLVKETDPINRVTLHAYDANGNLISTTDPSGQVLDTEYDIMNRPVRQVNALGYESRTVYDEIGRVVQRIDPLGNAVHYEYDKAGHTVREQDQLGGVTTFQYDSRDNVVRKELPNGAVWQYQYDGAGNMVEEIDPLGQSIRREYDALGRLVREDSPLGAVTRFEYDEVGNLVTQIDPRNASTRFEYDLLNRQVKEIDPMGRERVSVYDNNGQLTAVQDALGFVTQYQYDALGRDVSETNPMNAARAITYNAAGQKLTETDFNGQVFSLAYDLNGNLISQTDPLNQKTLTNYDALNRPVKVTDPLGRERTATYDEVGRIVMEISEGGTVTTYEYDAAGRRTRQTDPLGGIVETVYDPIGNAIQETDPLGRIRISTYDLLGRLISVTDALDRTTTYEYDADGRLTAVIGSDGTKQQYSYDLVGNMLAEQDGNGNITRYEYDLANQVIRKTDALGRVWRYRYDANNQLIGVRTPEGNLTEYAYDSAGQQISVSVNSILQTSYQYDNSGNRLRMADITGETTYQYDALNRLTVSEDPGGRMTLYGYDSLGRRTSLTYPTGETINYSYDVSGCQTGVSGPNVLTTYTCDLVGRVIAINQGNGVTVERSYDLNGNLLNETQKDVEGVIIAQQLFTYDAVNRKTQEERTLQQGTETIYYAYDDLDRLVSSTSSSGVRTDYTFDAAGNRLTQSGVRVLNGSLVGYLRNFTYNAVNQLVRMDDFALGAVNYTYNLDGSRISAVSEDTKHEYYYGADGRLMEARVWEKNGSAWLMKNKLYEQYIYDGAGRRSVVETRSAQGDSLLGTRTTLYDETDTWSELYTYETGLNTQETGYLNDAFLNKLAFWHGDAIAYIQHDALGSILGPTDSNGFLPEEAALRQYSDYGELLNPDESNVPLTDGYTGYQHDAYTGIEYARNRYYDASVGAFISSDPHPINHKDLLDLHRYAYVQANPTNMTDPLGLYPVSNGMNTNLPDGVSEDTRLAPGAPMAASEQNANRDATSSCSSASCQALLMQVQTQSISMTPSTCGQKGCNFAHVVTRGETLSLIGARYQTPWEWIYRENIATIGSNPNLIRVGQVLRIPCSDPGSFGNGGGAVATGASTPQAEYDYWANQIQNMETTVRELYMKYRMISDNPPFSCLFPFQLPSCVAHEISVKIMRTAIINSMNTLESYKVEQKRWLDPPSGLPTEGFISQGYHNAHKAIDIAHANPAPQVKSSMTGFVTFSGKDGSGGVYVDIENIKYKTRYLHLRNGSNIAKGTKVSIGTEVGTMGCTGISKGSYTQPGCGPNVYGTHMGQHLHYVVWEKVDGKWVERNPENYK